MSKSLFNGDLVQQVRIQDVHSAVEFLTNAWEGRPEQASKDGQVLSPRSRVFIARQSVQRILPLLAGITRRLQVEINYSKRWRLACCKHGEKNDEFEGDTKFSDLKRDKFGTVQKCANRVDLEKRGKMSLLSLPKGVDTAENEPPK